MTAATPCGEPEEIAFASAGQVKPENSVVAQLTGLFFAARIAVVFVFAQVLGTDPSTGTAATLILEALLLLLVCFHSLGVGALRARSMLRLNSVRWVAGFLTVSACSLAWSATVSLPVSAAYWSGLLMDVLIVVLLLRAGDVLATADSMLRGFVVGACCVAVLAWLMPSQADLRLGNQDFLNSNQIGNLCAIGCLFAQYLRKRAGSGWTITIAFLAMTLLRSLSKTTLLAFLLCEIVVLARDHTISRRTKAWIASAAVLTLITFSGLFAAYYDVYSRAGNQIDTLTGRTGIWAYVATQIPLRPWFGYGFDSMWKVFPPFGPDRFEARHAENEILQQAYTYGLAGVVLLAGLYGSLLRSMRKLPHQSLRFLLTAMLLFVGIRGLAEAEPFDLLLPLWNIVLFSVMIGVETETLPVQRNAAIPLDPRY